MKSGRSLQFTLVLLILVLFCFACGVDDYEYDYYDEPGYEYEDTSGDLDLSDSVNCDNQAIKIQETTFVMMGGATLTEVSTGEDGTKVYNLEPGDEACGTGSASGMLVQTSKSIENIRFFLNGAQISLGSTVFLTAPQSNQLAVNTLEGSARVTAGGKTTTSVAGTKLTVPVDDSFQVAGEPSELEPVDVYEDDFLPVDMLEYEFEYADPLDEDELNFFNEYDLLFDEIDVEDVDELYEYMSGQDGGDFVEYLVEELDYTNFDDDLEVYLQDDLGYDLEAYDGYTGEEFIEEDGEYIEDDVTDDTCDPEIEVCDEEPVEDDPESGESGGD